MVHISYFEKSVNFTKSVGERMRRMRDSIILSEEVGIHLLNAIRTSVAVQIDHLP
jgi:hypothetical protein